MLFAFRRIVDGCVLDLVESLRWDSLTPDEEDLLAILLGFERDFLVQTFDRHQNYAVLACGLETMFGLFFVADHQLGLFVLDLLQGGLLLCNLVCVFERGDASLFFELVHGVKNHLHLAATGLVPLFERLVRLDKPSVTRVDLLQVGELVLVLGLHVFKELFELLKLVHFADDAIVLRVQCLLLQLRLMDL